jgi:hypothetical protein
MTGLDKASKDRRRYFGKASWKQESETDWRGREGHKERKEEGIKAWGREKPEGSFRKHMAWKGINLAEVDNREGQKRTEGRRNGRGALQVSLEFDGDKW